MQQQTTNPARSTLERSGLEPRPMTALFSWTPFAVLLLTSAMIATMLLKIYQIDRTSTLAFQYFLWAVAIYLMLTVVPRRDWRLPAIPSRMSQSLVLFLLAFGISTAAVWLTGSRSDIDAVLPQSLALILMAAPFFAMDLAARTVRIDRMVMWTCHIILGLGLYSILADFFGLASYESGGGRYFGSLGDGVAWTLTLPLVVYFSAGRMPLAALAGLGLALTASRAPALVTAAALVLLMFFSRGRRFQYIAMILFMTAIALYQADLFTTLFHRISGTEFISNDRTATAALGIKIFLKSPIFGSGYNALTHFYPMSAERVAGGILPAQTSTLVQMLSDGGAITFLAYVGFLVVTSFSGVRLMRHSQHLPEGAILNGVVAWLLAMLWINQSALWFVVASYVGPIVFGMAGIVAGSWVRVLTTARLAWHRSSLAARE